MSLSIITSGNLQFHGFDNRCNITNSEGNVILTGYKDLQTGLFITRLYPLQPDVNIRCNIICQTREPVACHVENLIITSNDPSNLSAADKEAYIWHNRMGHLAFQQMQKMGFHVPKEQN